MRQGVIAMAIMAFFATAGVALGAVPRHYEGGVTLYGKGQMVVCSLESPYECSMIRLVSATRMVSGSSNRPAKLSRGEFVSVDAMAQPGSPVATLVRVYPDRFVRTIQGFKSAQSRQVESTLKGIGGIRSAQVNTQLGEAYIIFNDRTTSITAIERQAARKGVRLTLPGS